MRPLLSTTGVLTRILFLLALVSAAPTLAWADDASAPHAADTAETRSGAQKSAALSAGVRILNPGADSIKIGEALHLRVHADLPDDAQLVSLRPAANPFVERVGEIPRTPSARSGLTVTVFRPGTYDFKIEAVWIDGEGRQQSSYSEAIRVRVVESITNHEDAELRVPGDYVTLRSRNLWLLGGAAFALLSLAAIASWFLWRRLRPAPAPEMPAPPPRPAWEVALESIKALRTDRALLYEDPLQFHHRISEILRVWLQGRFQISAPEMTSEEILKELRPRRLALGGWIEKIHAILADSDLVKFAKFSPSPDDSFTLLQQLEDLVHEVQESDTSPPPGVPSPIEGNIPPVQPSERPSPQMHQPGAAEPRHIPEDAPKPTVLSPDFGRTKPRESTPIRPTSTHEVPSSGTEGTEDET